MENQKNLLYEYMLQQLLDMAENIKKKKKSNFQKRRNNPFNCFSTDLSNAMGLGRSIDSQLGNRLQNIAFFAARLKYGFESVPNYVLLGYDGLNSHIYLKLFSLPAHISTRQIVYLEHNINNISKYNMFMKHPIEFIREHITEKEFDFPCHPEIMQKSLSVVQTRDRNRRGIPIDLTIFPTTWGLCNYSFELKAGGNLDTKNAKANAIEVFSLKDMFSFCNVNEAYFATCYDGVGNGEPDGSILNELERNQILIGEEFWSMILPPEVQYKEFISMYECAFINAKVEEIILG